ncbi:MAG: hypothetical protein M0C28_01505 [Candidatus Moduliflexus flocculans]|nr:hypothetical protein [Candidatus Moduliflexus flocculans]
MPFSAIGAVWFLYLLGYNMSIGGLGRADRAAGRRRRDRRLHAPLPRPGLRARRRRRGACAAWPSCRRPSSTARSSACGPSS